MLCEARFVAESTSWDVVSSFGGDDSSGPKSQFFSSFCVGLLIADHGMRLLTFSTFGFEVKGKQQNDLQVIDFLIFECARRFRCEVNTTVFSEISALRRREVFIRLF
jgi:hypothetical protein